MNLLNAKILVTGGSSGLGKATAQLLKESGANVLITGRDAQKTASVAQQLGVHFCVADVSNPNDIAKTMQEVHSKLGGLDVLVNNAGIGKFKTITDYTLEDFEEVFRVNVFGAALMGQEAAKIMIPQQSGTIINIGSTAALSGFKSGSIYSASKFALRSMTECWRAELRSYNIRVIQINPSEVPTAFGSESRTERDLHPKKLTSMEIAYAIKSVLEMDDRGFIPELSVWATNPNG
ncbi:MAG: SDR family oxidoreductase [Candidatus Kapabacteria bacterium]|nr:SDR family oxidoreductase [Candidatus Kapabacteria bacterium]